MPPGTLGLVQIHFDETNSVPPENAGLYDDLSEVKEELAKYNIRAQVM